MLKNFRRCSLLAVLALCAFVTSSSTGCSDEKSKVIDAAPGTRPPTDEELATANAKRDLEMSGTAAEMQKPQGAQ